MDSLRNLIDPAPSPSSTAETEAPFGNAQALDREHQAHVSDVETCDTADARREKARSTTGLMVEQEQELLGQKKLLGGVEHLNAIERSGWFPYSGPIRIGSQLLMSVDAVLWTGLWAGIWWLWIQYFEDTNGTVPPWLYVVGLPVVPIAGLVAARAAKGLGRHIAVTGLTDSDSVRRTLDRQVRIAGLTAVAAVFLLLAIMALAFLLPPSWSSWSSYAGGLVAFGANIALGFSAGLGGNAAHILQKPGIRDTIDCQVEMKLGTRRVLAKYVGAFILSVVLLSVPGASWAAEGVWVWALDATDSVDRAQANSVVEQMIDAAPVRSSQLDVAAIQIVKFHEDVMLSEMTWIRVPPEPTQVNCSKARPKPTLMKGLGLLSPTLAAGRRQEAVDSCTADLRAEVQAHAERIRVFKEQLRAGARLTPRTGVHTRIVPLLAWLVGRPDVVAIDVLTDGIDNSGNSVSLLRIPESMQVRLIITRPNRERKSPTVCDVLSAAEAWAHVPGITVTSAGEFGGNGVRPR